MGKIKIVNKTHLYTKNYQNKNTFNNLAGNMNKLKKKKNKKEMKKLKNRKKLIN